jgi:hypothetical protein
MQTETTPQWNGAKKIGKFMSVGQSCFEADSDHN